MDSGMFNSSLTVNSSWLLWYDCWSPLFYMYIFCDISNGLLGLSTNIWVIVLILKNWRTQAAQELSTFNLAVMEIICCVLSQILVLNFLVFKIACISEASWCVYELNIISRAVFQCGMSLERYLAVVCPVFFFKHWHMRYKAAFLIAGWLITVFLCVFTSIYAMCTLFFVVLAMESFFSLSILKVLKQPSPGEGGKKTEELNLMKKRASRTVQIILASVMINCLPIFIETLLSNKMSRYNFLCVYRPLGYSFGVMGSFVQPLLYLHRTGKLSCLSPKGSLQK